MRWYILKTLLLKEVLRHLSNRGGLALAALLVAAAMLLSFFRRDDLQASALLGGINRCYVDYWEDGGWIDHLRGNVPDSLSDRIAFRPVSEVPAVNGVMAYEAGSGAIQVRVIGRNKNGPRYLVWFWHSGGDSSQLPPFEAWFWKETGRYYQAQTRQALDGSGAVALVQMPDIEEDRSQLHGTTDPRAPMATALVLFGLFFVCIYLLPSLTCEEHERGILLAQALSPASALEILAAKCLFYPAAAMCLSALVAAIYSPAILTRPFFWLALAVAAFGALGIGLTIASLARTQRTASMGALCYMLAIAMILLICQQNRIPIVPYFVLEYHSPRMIHAALTGTAAAYHQGHLAAAAALAVGWLVLAVELFKRRGWQ